MMNRNLVVMPYGNDSLESAWIFNSEQRGFDMVLLFYHPTISKSRLREISSAFALFELRDFKWVMIQQFFSQHPNYLSQYDYFFFPDDDIEVSLSTIQTLFKWMNKFELQLTQPVLSRDSYKSWRVLRKKRLSGMRYLSAVELMCPMMHQDALRELLPTFNLNQSGWGIDILWGELTRKKFGDRSIAVFDLLVAKHTKPVGKGELYNKLGKSAFEERDEIFEKYQISQRKIYSLPLPENSLLAKLQSFFSLRRELIK